jgi:hypothetical protein
VAGRRPGEVRDFAADPHQRKGAFQQARDLLVERGNGQDGWGGVGRIGVLLGEHRNEQVNLSTKIWLRLVERHI